METTFDRAVGQLVQLRVDRRIGRHRDQQLGDRRLRPADEVPEVDEDAIRWHLVQERHREPMIEEHVDARSVEPPLGDLLTPVVAVEVPPVRTVEGGDVRALRFGDLEQEVLHQVRGEQSAPAVIQGLEDDLGVVAGFQVDHHELQVVAQRPDQRTESLDRGGRIALDDRPRL